MENLGKVVLIILILYGMGKLSKKNEERVEGTLKKLKDLFK
ncbi:MAG: hypothetical protein ABFR75_04685 [Acidobacteriota bacterium]